MIESGANLKPSTVGPEQGNNRSKPHTVWCPVCGFSYIQGLPGEARRHAAYHRHYLHPVKPKPNPRLAAYDGDVRVDGASPRWLNRLVYTRAHALQRDIGLDFPQWRWDGPPKPAGYERDLHAWLLVEDKTTPVGVVGFTFIKGWKDDALPPGWHLFMAWVADAWRRKGVMSRRWAGWRQIYGDFTVEQPNRQMRALMRKMAGDAPP
jgi:hypothetical protein